MGIEYTDIEYRVNQPISRQQFVELLQQTSLGPRRPLDNHRVMQGMLDNANLLVTAWHQQRLVGVGRAVTDFVYCCYLSDLAVAEDCQGQGIGKQLIRELMAALEPGCKLLLVAAPKAVDYYPAIGFTQHPTSTWTLDDVRELR
ncbi:GNAT family N-acetyltransferase [Parathalassolituus penaei]|uniref:GNAT family N-acetyltransferase n=1 Tax=Parathalassolituus penaei TaxID=2997323 RepID=A0A9X3EAH8_9GAMM|nr:GNAT family N-acetyltransferase [Parathalassolituus penaei]MCY0963957.1 GNAT family N-acetyltransferase [Parathalassolituus penaei]